MKTVKVKYVGIKSGPSPYFGSATGTMYRFGTLRPEQEVFEGDVDGFMAFHELQKPAFEVVGKKVELKEEKPKEREQDSEPKTVTEQEPKPAVENPVPQPVEPFDFTTLSGIGPARQQALHDAQITTKEHFLAASNETLADLLGANEKTIKSWRDSLS